MEDELIPLSYLSQYYYCKRRASLLLNGQYWQDNSDTVDGTYDHRNVHESGVERRGNKLKINEMCVFSNRLKLIGKCDCVEGIRATDGTYLPFCKEKYTLYPVEYKHGVVRDELEYNIQLCAQAMCMEEMFGGVIHEGAVFYTDSHRREAVTFTKELREYVAIGAKALTELLASGELLPATYSAKCGRCSMRDLCLPKAPQNGHWYLDRLKKCAEPEVFHEEAE